MPKRVLDKQGKIAALTAAAERGLHITAAARETGVSLRYARQLADDFSIVFPAAPTDREPMPIEHYRRIGRLSAASPKHYNFTDADRRRGKFAAN